MNVDVLAVQNSQSARAAKEATRTIPIVFTIANDPVGGGLVPSLSRPGGNATGLSQLAADLGGKRIEILREIVPGLTRLATLSNATNPVTASEMAQVQEAARTLGVEIIKTEISHAEDIARSRGIDAKPRASIGNPCHDPENTSCQTTCCHSIGPGIRLCLAAHLRHYHSAQAPLSLLRPWLPSRPSSRPTWS
jgi:ABC-type uncharacterized transport system substrate-binding protein